MSESHINTLAIRKAATEGWEPFRYEVVGKDAFLITGGVPRLLKSGPRKGQKTWNAKSSTKVVITEAELQAERLRYSAETGNCFECYGKGEVMASWSAAEGTKYRQCRHCNSTGRATSQGHIST